MRIRNASLGVLLFLAATPAFVQARQAIGSPSAPDAAPIVGVWRGAQADGMPVITLTVTNETGILTGAVLFYFYRQEEGKPVTSTPSIPEPLFNMNFDGQALTFQISHRHANPPRSLSDPPISFRLKLTGTNSAGLPTGVLTNETYPSTGPIMIRTAN